MAVCANCGQVLPEDARFCLSCGTSTSTSSPCASCGHPVPAGARFCHGCGAPVASVPPPQVEADRALVAEFEKAVHALSELLSELEANQIDLPTFQRRAIHAGMIVRDDEVWLLEIQSGQWWRYDGVGLRPLDAQPSAETT